MLSATTSMTRTYAPGIERKLLSVVEHVYGNAIQTLTVSPLENVASVMVCVGGAALDLVCVYGIHFFISFIRFKK